MNSRKKVNFAKLGQTSTILTSLALPTIISGTTTHATPVRPRVTKPPSPTTNRPPTRPSSTTPDFRRLTLYNGLYDSIYGPKKSGGISGGQQKPTSASIVTTHTTSSTATSESVNGTKITSTPLTNKQPSTKPLTIGKLTVGQLNVGKIVLKPSPTTPEEPKPISARIVTTHTTSGTATSENVNGTKTTATPLSDKQPSTRPLNVGQLTVGQLNVGKIVLKPSPTTPEEPKPVSARIVSLHPTSGGTATSENIGSVKMTATPLPTRTSTSTGSAETTDTSSTGTSTTGTTSTPTPPPKVPYTTYTGDSTYYREKPGGTVEILATKTLNDDIQKGRYVHPFIREILKEAEERAGEPVNFPAHAYTLEHITFLQIVYKYAEDGNPHARYIIDAALNQGHNDF